MATREEKLEGASPLKRSVYYAVEDPSKGGSFAKVFGIALLVLIIVNALLVFIETESVWPDWAYFLFFVVGSASTVIFGVEYFLRLWVADIMYPDRKPGKARLRYMLSLMGIIDLLAFVPGVMALFVQVSSQMLNAARIIRLVRLIKISRYMKGLQSIGRVFHKGKQEIIAAFMVLFLLTVTASVLMYAIENPAQPENFDSVFTGMYWAMTTITSTGYGDLVPITAAGRFVGFFTMLLAIAAVAIPAGIFSAGFVSEFRKSDIRAKADDIRTDAVSADKAEGTASLEGESGVSSSAEGTAMADVQEADAS